MVTFKVFEYHHDITDDSELMEIPKNQKLCKEKGEDKLAHLSQGKFGEF
jgi:hypothetical protein